MGCEQSKLSKTPPIPLSIVDSHFLKPENSPLVALLEKHNIQPNVFMSIDCLLDSLAQNYTHNIVVRETDHQKAMAQLGKAKLEPRVFVLGSKKEGNLMGKRVFFFEKYEDLPQLLNKHEIEQPVQKQGRTVDVQILQDFKRQASSQFFIFQQTLKKQGITYQLHSSFSELEHSRTISALLVVDYRFHRAARALHPKSKVICYCDLSEEQTYDPQTFFISSNFQEIVNEILISKQLTQPVLPISKIFLCSHSPRLLNYAPVFQNFALKVKPFTSISELIKKTRLYFSVMVVCPQEEAAQMQKKIQEQGCAFRMRILPIPSNTQCSAVGLRRTLRQVKRGYLVERGPSKAVDIIDKYHSSTKFDEIKRELTSKDIAFKCYNNITSYCKTLTFISPVVICNFDDRLLLHRFLKQVQIKAKVIVFCNRSKITQQLTRDTRWSFVSSHFGKIIRYIKTHHVLLPKFLEQTPKKVESKGKEHRISAVKWAQQSNSHNNSHQQFVLKENNNLGIQCASLLKMTTKPLQQFQDFRKNLTQAVSALRSQFKLNILDSDFTSMVNELSQANLMQLMLRTRRFLSDQKDMGIGLNSVLKDGNQEQMKNAKEVIFLLCLNFIGIYQLPFSESVRLSCWSQQNTLKQCSPGNSILCRNFLVMRQQFLAERLPGCVKLQMELQYSAVKSLRSEFSPFFVFQGRYVFAPHSQLQVTKIEGEGDARILHIKLLPQNTFLSQYLEQNINKDILSTFKQQLAKPQTLLTSSQQKQHLYTNLARIEAYNHSQTNLSQSIQIQRQLIRLEEQTDNFDSRLLTELKYELATYLSLETESSEQLMDLIAEIKDSSPSPFIKQQCAAILGQLQGFLSHRKEKAKTIKCIQLKQQIQRDSQDEQDEQDQIEQEHCIQYDTIFQCLQLDEREGLAQQFS